MPVKSKVKISQNFVAFSEYMNLTLASISIVLKYNAKKSFLDCAYECIFTTFKSKHTIVETWKYTKSKYLLSFHCHIFSLLIQTERLRIRFQSEHLLSHGTSRDIHIECSKQFKWNSYFYVSGQSRPFWAALKLL